MKIVSKQEIYKNYRLKFNNYSKYLKYDIISLIYNKLQDTKQIKEK